MKVACSFVFYVLIVEYVQCREEGALRRIKVRRRTFKDSQVPSDKYMDEGWSDGNGNYFELTKTVSSTKNVPETYEVTVENKEPNKFQIPDDKFEFVPKKYPEYFGKKLPHESKVSVPQQPYNAEKHVPVPVKVPVDRPYPVEVPYPYPIYLEKKVPYTVEKRVPYPVRVAIEKPYPVHVPVEKEVPIRVDQIVRVPIKVPVERPVPQLVEKPVPYTLESPAPYLDEISVKEAYSSEEDKHEALHTPEVYEDNSSNEEVSNFSDYEFQQEKNESHNISESEQYKNEKDKNISEPEQSDNEEDHDLPETVDEPQDTKASSGKNKDEHQSYSHIHTMSFTGGHETGFYSVVNHRVT